jgi:hypothetical protein
MWRFFYDIKRTVLQFIYQLNSQYEWGLFLLIVLVVGVICLRGFGSFKHY